VLALASPDFLARCRGDDGLALVGEEVIGIPMLIGHQSTRGMATPIVAGAILPMVIPTSKCELF
jgi:hypothetical protein